FKNAYNLDGTLKTTEEPAMGGLPSSVVHGRAVTVVAGHRVSPWSPAPPSVGQTVRVGHRTRAERGTPGRGRPVTRPGRGATSRGR
ncbi:hypothetical protein ACWEK7_32730, partial [Streptomyces californicus]